MIYRKFDENGKPMAFEDWNYGCDETIRFKSVGESFAIRQTYGSLDNGCDPEKWTLHLEINGESFDIAEGKGYWQDDEEMILSVASNFEDWVDCCETV